MMNRLKLYLPRAEVSWVSFFLQSSSSCLIAETLTSETKEINKWAMWDWCIGVISRCDAKIQEIEQLPRYKTHNYGVIIIIMINKFIRSSLPIFFNILNVLFNFKSTEKYLYLNYFWCVLIRGNGKYWLLAYICL